MRVAITGGSGVVGATVLRHLIAAGNEVRALCRSKTAAAKVAGLGGAPVTGDLLDRRALATLVEGCERVFHVAGVNELCSPDPDHMWRVNVDGTEAVIEACSAASVPRLVHTSSAVTIGQERGQVGDEETKHRGWFLTEYERSKYRAEELALIHRGGPEVVVVNPSSVQGPGRSTGTGRILLAAARGRLPVTVRTTFSLVDIDDCARGHLLAAERGMHGQRYLLSGAILTMGDALDLLAEVTGRKPRVLTMPAALFSFGARTVEAGFSLAGKQPPICRETARVLAFGQMYDGCKAKEELGLEYTPAAKTLARTVKWFEEEGLLRAEDHEKCLAE